MRTLYDIIAEAKAGGKPAYDELLYALLAVDALAHMAEFWAEESFQRNKGALNADPKAWLGWDNDPSNPEYRKRRKIAIRLAEAALAGKLDGRA
jgi:hypothetical protein